MNKVMHANKRVRNPNRWGRTGLIALVMAAAASGCAGTGSNANPDTVGSGSRVEVYGEIDMGYGYSRTKTIGERK